MYLINTPRVIKRCLPQLIWEMPSGENILYLTFDDGPHPEITRQTLQILKEFQATSTFFCVGENAQKHPEIIEEILVNNHAVGSHTFHHLNGWRTKTDDYLQDVFLAADLLNTSLFRPPYGRLRPSQIKSITPRLKIIMWSVLSGDFDQRISPQECFDNCVRHARDGSIIVFHDSEKAAKRMLYTLPRLLEFFTAKGFSFRPLPL